MLPVLLLALLIEAAPPVPSHTTGRNYTDTLLIPLTLAPAVMRFSQSADQCALLAGQAYAGFGANPAALGIPAAAAPFGLSVSSQYSTRMPMLNLPTLYDFSQSFAVTAPGGSRSRLGAGVAIRAMALGAGRSAKEYSVGAGRRMDASGSVTQDLGVSLKLVAADGFRAADGTEPSPGILADIGYLATFGGFLRAGAAVENLGKGATGVRPVLSRLSGDGNTAFSLSVAADPDYSLTPLTFTLGAALFRTWDSRTLHVFEGSLAGTWAKMPGDGPSDQSFTTVVAAAGLFRTFGGQFGFLRDPSSAEIQGKRGVSLSLFNHFRFAFVTVAATGGLELFQGQKGLSLTLSDLQSWKRGDLTWWRTDLAALR